MRLQEDTAEKWKELQNHKDKLEEAAKDQLRALLTEENPGAIDKALPEFTKYGEALTDQVRHESSPMLT